MAEISRKLDGSEGPVVSVVKTETGNKKSRKKMKRKDWVGLSKSFNLVRSQYYAPYVTELDYEYQHEHDDTRQGWVEVVVQKRPKHCNGHLYFFELWGHLSMKVCFNSRAKKGREISLDFHIYKNWANNQNWEYLEPRVSQLLPKGLITINGEDPGYDPDDIKELKAARKAARRKHYEMILEKAVEEGISKAVAQRIVRKHNVATLEGVVGLKGLFVDKQSANKVARKGYARAYAIDVLGPDAAYICRLFENTLAACEEYSRL